MFASKKGWTYELHSGARKFGDIQIDGLHKLGRQNVNVEVKYPLMMEPIRKNVFVVICQE